MTVHDEVCGMDIDRDTAATSVEFQGERYYFCSTRCRGKFQDHPSYYVVVGNDGEKQSEDRRPDG